MFFAGICINDKRNLVDCLPKRIVKLNRKAILKKCSLKLKDRKDSKKSVNFFKNNQGLILKRINTPISQYTCMHEKDFNSTNYIYKKQRKLIKSSCHSKVPIKRLSQMVTIVELPQEKNTDNMNYWESRNRICRTSIGKKRMKSSRNKYTNCSLLPSVNSKSIQTINPIFSPNKPKRKINLVRRVI